MKNKVKIANKAVDSNVLAELDMFSGKVSKKTEFLKIVVQIYNKAIVINWSIKHIGFGQYSFYLDDNLNLKIDDENLGEDLTNKLFKEVIKRYHKGNLEVENNGESLLNLMDLLSK